MGLEWEYSEAPVLKLYTPGCIIVKHENTKYAYHPSRARFIEEWLTEVQNKKSHPVYELIVTEHPARLYFDIEGVYPEKPTDEILKQWLLDIINVIKPALDAIGVDPVDRDCFVVSSDCRAVDYGYKRSFHLTWPNVIFRDNYDAMKHFFDTRIKSVIIQDPRMCWMKKCKHEMKLDYVIDCGVYSRKRALRLAYSRKNGKTCLVPWDIEKWAALDFANPSKHLDWIESSLVSGADVECSPIIERVMISTPTPTPTPITKTTTKQGKKPTHQLEEAPVEEQDLARMLIVCLSKTRSEEFGMWSQVVWALSDTFGGNEKGRLVAQNFSCNARNYDAAAVDEMYHKANGRLKFGSLVKWATDDSPAMARMIMQQSRQTIQEEPPTREEEMNEPSEDVRLDVTKLDVWWDTYQCSMADFKTKMDDAASAKNYLELATLSASKSACQQEWEDRILGYLNTYLCVITKLPEPAYLEQYGHTGRLERALVVRKNTHFLSAFRKRKWMKFWINHNQRREFDKITFNPRTKDHTEYEFNIFTGLAHQTSSMSFEEAEVACKPFIDHIRNYWCPGDEKLTTFVLGWFAHLVQRPWIKMASALVLRGDEGCGKGCILEKIRDVIGAQYYYQVQNVNASLFHQFTPENFEQCLLLFVDEATWGGCKKEAGILKKIVSELTHEIEHKHGARFTVQSFMNVVFASNEAWVVPAGFKARRWVCIDCNNHMGGITGESAIHFAGIRDVKNEALASYLLQYNLEHFNPRAAPVTDMLRDQKRRRFDTVTAWWDDALKAGHLAIPDGLYPQGHPDHGIPQREWGETVSNEELFAMYQQHKGHERGVSRTNDLFRELRSLVDLGKPRRRTLYGKREYATDLPTLKDGRTAFCAKCDDPNWFHEYDEEVPIN